jgi:hypothetical protein
MNGKENTLRTQPYKQGPATATGDTDVDTTYTKVFAWGYPEPSMIEIDDDDATISMTADETNWGDSIVPDQDLLITPSIFELGDSFAYVFQGQVDPSGFQPVCVLFYTFSTSLAARDEPLDPPLVGVWMGTTSGGVMPDCLRGARLFSSAKPGA